MAEVAAAAVFTVAPTGNDANPGTAEQPWRTISHAAATVGPGSIVDVRGGTYDESVTVKVSGEEGRPIVFQEHPGEQVVISGQRRRRPSLLAIRGRRHLVFDGFEITGLRGDAIGVRISGRSSNIVLRHLDVNDIRTKGGDAHGIIVSGDKPITEIVIERNFVHDLELGSSEAVVLNGDVSGWAVVGNTITDVNNIGIDAIGYEGTAPRNDRARNGLIAGNVVSNVDTKGNPAYREDGGNCRCAGGIYVDGGDDIVIERNVITRSNLGIELASEHRRGVTSDVLVRNNLILHSDGPGMPIGGYDSRRGRTARVQVVNNTLIGNDRLRTEQGELLLNYRVSDSLFLNNVVVAGRQGLLVGNFFRTNTNNTFDGNVWFAPGRTRWQWRRREVRSFGAWQDASGGDAHGSLADPLAGPDGRPAAGSPAIDAGVPTDLAGATDVTGAPRVQGAAVDAGAFEAAP